jgi:hypothetical protein
MRAFLASYYSTRGFAKETNAIGGHFLNAFFSSASSKATLNTRNWARTKDNSNFRRT